MEKCMYPFGQHMVNVEQKDKNKKDIFVLGVYASAVHAKWIDANGKMKIKALAVASEPYIFWRGENAEDIISKIEIPSQLGKLVGANKMFNGPSGRVLDEMYLDQLEFTRENSWLCDLVPHSYLNERMTKAIEERYNPYVDGYNLARVTIPTAPEKITIGEDRLQQILAEIETADPKVIILLGDASIRALLGRNSMKSKLSDFGDTCESYGELHEYVINDRKRIILPLAHPRQVGALGLHTGKWYKLHKYWIENKARKISKTIKEKL